jgi:hypothetical protein
VGLQSGKGYEVRVSFPGTVSQLAVARSTTTLSEP